MRRYRILLFLVVVLAALSLGSCGGDGGEDEPVLGRFTGECPRGPLGFWDCNMTWDQECWQ
jgi:hypothetical protein